MSILGSICHLNVGCNEVMSRNAVVSTMDSKTKVSRVFNNNPQGSRLRGRPKAEGGTVSIKILINTKLQIAKRSQKTEVTGRSPLRRRISALDCSTI
jgi:hypothetical protein